MYKELKKFKNAGIFSFTAEDDLEQICNAPQQASGVFLVYAGDDDQKELILVGSTGTVQNDGTLKSKSGGLFDKIVNGQQFKAARKYSWAAQMKLEGVEKLEVHWHETFNAKQKFIPTFVEAQILQLFLTENSRLPKWNIAF